MGHGWSDLRDRELDMVDVHASEGLAEARVEEERRQMRTKPKLAGDDFVYQVSSDCFDGSSFALSPSPGRTNIEGLDSDDNAYCRSIR